LVIAEMEKEMAVSRYEGFSDDETVRVVLGGNLTLLRCDITQAAAKLGREAVSSRVAEATVDAHAQAVAGKRGILQEMVSHLGVQYHHAEEWWKSAVAGTAMASVAAAWATPLVATADEGGIDPFFQFQPVCPAADGVFRVGQQAALAVAGTDNIDDYRPLINDVLIRVRTELCVLESFARETAVPFVQQKGLGWVLPVHETSETYLAGVVFMVGTNFILLGSTKVLAILAIYHDIVVGLPARLLSRLLGFAGGGPARVEKQIDKLLEKQNNEMSRVMLDKSLDSATRTQKASEVSAKYATQLEEVRTKADVVDKERETSALGQAGRAAGAVAVPLRVYGFTSEKLKEVLEAFDTFCSRYLVAVTVLYVIIKTLHYVVFLDIIG
jgi:DNA-binding protein YbaB